MKFFKPISFGSASLLLMIASLFSYLLGLIRDLILAYYFGATAVTDAYNTAFLVPDLIFTIITAGAITGVFLPIFRNQYLEDKKAAARLAAAFLWTGQLMVLGLSVVAFVAMPWIVQTFFYAAEATQAELIVNLSRIMLVSPFLFSLSNSLGSILMSFKHYLSYALSAGFYNLGIIAGILLFHEEYGIYSAAFGVIFGLFLHLGLRLIDLKGLDFKIGFALNAPKLKEIFVLSVPKTLGLVVWQFSLLAYNVIGYSLVAGSISSFNLARNVQSFAVSLFGIAVATAVFPYLVDHKELGESEMLQQKVEFTILQILFYTLPACAGLAVLSLQTSQFLFGRGAFSPEAVLLTAGILFYFSFSIPFESLMHLFSRIFYAFKNTWTPVLINFVFLAINLSLSIYLAKIYGAQAFSIAFTIGNVIQVGLLYLFLSRYLKLNIQFLITQIFKLFLATAGMTLVVYYIQDWNYILVIAVGVVVYFVQTKLLGMIRFAGLQRFNFLKKYEFFS